MIILACNILIDSHVGDLGNVAVDSNGNVNVTITDNVISLVGSRSIIGKSFVVSIFYLFVTLDDVFHGLTFARINCGKIASNSRSDNNEDKPLNNFILHVTCFLPNFKFSFCNRLTQRAFTGYR
jgi:Copper/zinc superoxide dismutase (SODC)